jgi:multiple sugar transport system permease protein
MSSEHVVGAAAAAGAGRRGGVGGTPFGMSRAQTLLVHAVLVLLCVPALLPMAWMVSTSLKADEQIYASQNQAAKGAAAAAPFSAESLVPQPVKWRNYPEAMTTVPFLTYLKNTLVLCLLTVVGVVLSSAIVAYGFARLAFRGRDVWFYVMISTMALPGQVTMIPVFALFRALGWYGTFLPLVVPAFFGAPFFIFLLTQFFKTLPGELAESARVDGAREWTIFTRVILPLAKPALATVALFQFIGTWNDFFGPLLYLNDPGKYTLAYGLQQFLSSYGGKWAQLMAAATVFTLPIILLFFFAQRTFIQGVATTGGK